MVIFPAIDIRNGKCVRLIQGDFLKETIYPESPLEIALKWKEQKAQYVHIVDLDGAKDGESNNLEIIIEIVKKLNIPIQFGGGIRSLEKIELLLSSGVERVILGTAAVNNKYLLKEALRKYEEKIVIGIDAKDGFVAIEGWTNKSNLKATDFAKIIEYQGGKTVIYTDISKDGMLTGPNLKEIEEIVNSVKMDIIASGGVSKLEDLKKLRGTGVKGVIVGKALYNNAIRMEDALKC